jgi:hypothetical protein
MFYANRRISSLSKPSGFVDRQGAREMVEAGLATWTKGAKGIMMKKTEAQIAPTARSLKMGADVIMLNAMGDEAAMALVAAWEPRIVAARYQQAA